MLHVNRWCKSNITCERTV